MRALDVRLEDRPAVQERELDHERVGDHLAALPRHELGGGLRGPARREDVVDDDDARAGPDRVLVHLELGDAVLGLVGDLVALGRQLPGLSRGDEARVEPRGERAAEDEAAGLDADDDVDVLADEALGDRVEDDVERPRVGEERRDVLEEDPRGREVRDVADLALRVGERLRPKAWRRCYPIAATAARTVEPRDCRRLAS